MTTYIIRRMASSVLVFIVSTFATFVFLMDLRDDALRTGIRRGCDPACDEDTVNAIGAPFGLGRSIFRRYGDWLTDAVGGDFGRTRRFGEPVGEIIGPALLDTLAYAVPAMALVMVGSAFLGLWSARQWHTWREHLVSIGSLALFATPPFLVPLVLQLFWGIWWPEWTGTRPFRITGVDIVSAGEIPSLLAMPVAAVAVTAIPTDFRFIRMGMRSAINADFIRTARAKGVSERRIVTRHLMRAGLASAAPLWGITFATVLAASVYIEAVFGIQGVGALLVDGVNTNDTFLVLGLVGVLAFAVTLVNLLADIALAWIDPRVRLG